MVKKAVTIIVLFFFMIGGNGSIAYSSVSSSCLSPWVLSDSHPMRSLDPEDCKKAKPGAVGKGTPLERLFRGEDALPPLLIPDPHIRNEIISKIKNSVKIAVKLYSVSEHENELSPSDRERADAAIFNMLDLFENTFSRLYLFNSIVRGEGEYLMAFSYGDKIGLDPELIRFLYDKSPLRLAQLIFHECVPENIIDRGTYLDLADHSYIYNVIQTAIFGKDEVSALGEDLRAYKSYRRIMHSEQLTYSLTKRTRDILNAMDNKLLDLYLMQSGSMEEQELGEILLHSLRSEPVDLISALGMAYGSPDGKVLFGKFHAEDVLWFLYSKGVVSKEELGSIVREIRDKKISTLIERYRLSKKARGYLSDLRAGLESSSGTGYFQSEGDRFIKREKLEAFYSDPERWLRLSDIEMERTIQMCEADLAGLRGQGENNGIFYNRSEAEKSRGAFPLYMAGDSTGLDVENSISENRELLAQASILSGKIKYILMEIDSRAVEGIVDKYGLDAGDAFTLWQIEEDLLKASERAGQDDGDKYDSQIRLNFFRSDPIGYINERIRSLKRSIDNITFVKIAGTVTGSGSEEKISLRSTQEILMHELEIFTALMAKIDPFNKDLYSYFGEGSTGSRGHSDNSDNDIEFWSAFLFNRLKVLSKEMPREKFIIAIDTDMGREDQGAQVSIMFRMVDRIRDMRDEKGELLLPNLEIIRASGSSGSLTDKVYEKMQSGVRADNIFMAVKQDNLTNRSFYILENKTWIAAIDDSRKGDIGNGVYLPVIEALTVAIMSRFNSDTISIRDLYESISYYPEEDAVISGSSLLSMIDSRIISIIPKSDPVDLETLKDRYESTRRIYLSA